MRGGEKMASKRRIRRRSCEGKIRHKSKEAAFLHIRGLRNDGKDTNKQCHFYRCKFCKGWHVGRRRM